jgi:hypothetical protein
VIRRIAVMFSSSEGNPQSMRDLAALKKGLQERGWTERRNLEIDVRWPGPMRPSRGRSRWS